MPITAHEKNEVFVGRIRRDNSIENGLDMWIVADNLRKGQLPMPSKLLPISYKIS